MKNLFYPLLLLALFSCKEKNPSKLDYLQRALKSDAYKIAVANVKRVKDSLDLVKKGFKDTNAIIFLYNYTIADSTRQAKNMFDVKEGMKKDTGFLKSLQIKIADNMAKDHQDSISKVKP